MDDTGEVWLLISYELHRCRHCSSERIRRYGSYRNGVARYMCNGCGRTFGVSTNIIFYNHRIPMSEWIGFLLDIIGFGSFSLTSKVNRNSDNTTRYWLEETCLKVRGSDIGRRADGLEYRGVSKNQMCIGIVRVGTHSVFLFEGLGKPTGKPTVASTWGAFAEHIGRGSTLRHGREHSRRALVEGFWLCSEA